MNPSKPNKFIWYSHTVHSSLVAEQLFDALTGNPPPNPFPARDKDVGSPVVLSSDLTGDGPVTAVLDLYVPPTPNTPTRNCTISLKTLISLLGLIQTQPSLAFDNRAFEIAFYDLAINQSFDYNEVRRVYALIRFMYEDLALRGFLITSVRGFNEDDFMRGASRLLHVYTFMFMVESVR